METHLNFEYDDEGDILSIQTVPPYPEQETDQVEYNVFVRRNPRSKVIEGVEVLFFTKWLFKQRTPDVRNLTELFSRSAA